MRLRGDEKSLFVVSKTMLDIEVDLLVQPETWCSNM